MDQSQNECQCGLENPLSQESNRMLSEESSRIFYECLIGEIPGKILCTFTTTDQLMRAKYYLDPNYINLSFYVKDYKIFQELLSQKYGEPFKKRETTVNKATISEAEWPIHLDSGNLRLETLWNTDRSEISLTTSKVGDNIIIQIDYVSKEMTKTDLVQRDFLETKCNIWRHFL